MPQDPLKKLHELDMLMQGIDEAKETIGEKVIRQRRSILALHAALSVVAPIAVLCI